MTARFWRPGRGATRRSGGSGDRCWQPVEVLTTDREDRADLAVVVRDDDLAVVDRPAAPGVHVLLPEVVGDDLLDLFGRALVDDLARVVVADDRRHPAVAA